MKEGVVSVLGLVITVTVSLTAGVLGGVLHARRQPPPPHIVVLDMRRLIEPVMNNGALDDAARVKQATEIGTAIRQAVDRYAADGTIVLDASAVLRAPQALYVEP